MRKFSYAIGIFCTVFLLSLGFYASYQYGCSKDREYSDPALEAENPLSTSYYIQLEDGKVIVRLEDGTVYETTEISKETLPVSVQEKISQGYVLTSKQELYSILENFSS